MSAIPEFGRRVVGVTYVMRPGGYVVLVGERGEVAVTTGPGGLFLPGGGQEGDETPEQAAIREAREECGIDVELCGSIGVADELVFGTGERLHFRKRCTFFRAAVVRRDGEHDVAWMTSSDAMARLCHDSQRWAVARACG